MSKSPSLRRIQADVRELAIDPSDRYHAAPMENDMFEWYVSCTYCACLYCAYRVFGVCAHCVCRRCAIALID
jgi:ubiquitin-protein ligase